MSTIIPVSITISSGNYLFLKYSCARAKNAPGFERRITVESAAFELDSRDFCKFEISDRSSSFEEIFCVKLYIRFIALLM